MSRALSILLITLAVVGAGAPVPAAEDVRSGPACGYCGMDREKFAHTRMLVRYTDGSAAPTCSLHCAAVELALAIDKTPKEILVGDYGTKELVDAEAATWVVGGKLMGVMTRNGKWAFRDRADAEKFAAANGGALAGFDEAIKAAYTDMYEDTKLIRERRRMRRR